MNILELRERLGDGLEIARGGRQRIIDQELERFTVDQLVSQLRQKEDLVDSKGRIHLAAFELVSDLVPLPCSDFIPVKIEDGVSKIGVITRAIPPEAGKTAILGGRTNHNEQDDVAVRRHLASLGVPAWSFYPGNDVRHPFFRQTYYHGAVPPTPNDGFDPAKHSIACTYLIELAGDTTPKLEASNFHWITRGEIPDQTAFNHRVAMTEAFKWLESNAERT